MSTAKGKGGQEEEQVRKVGIVGKQVQTKAKSAKPYKSKGVKHRDGTKTTNNNNGKYFR